MATIRIHPRFKLLVVYDVRPEVYAPYQRYILNEFIPAMQDMQLYVLGVWHTAYGEYPARQIEFVMEDLDIMRAALEDERWADLEERLKAFTNHYQRKLVRFRDSFQFVG